MSDFLGKYGLKLFILTISLIIVSVSLNDWSRGSELREGTLHSKINNYLIFKTAYKVLNEGCDIYAVHPKEHYDVFKYSPTFAFFMAPFYYLPTWVGLCLWNLLNFFTLFFALKFLPGMGDKKVLIVLVIGVFELIGSVMNEQSNGLMAGLVVLSIALMERKQVFWAMAVLLASVYIKLFSLVFLAMLFFYPNVIKNALYALFWLLFYAFIPVMMTGYEQLITLYESWGFLLAYDHSTSLGYSLMGVLGSWFNLHPDKFFLVVIGLILTMLPILKVKSYNHQDFRYGFMSSLLIWVIVFNHKAESPAFIIAMTGIGIWFVTGEQTSLKKYLLAFAILFVSIGFSDLTPKFIREAFFYKYSLKSLPGLVIWAWIIYSLLRTDFRKTDKLVFMGRG